MAEELKECWDEGARGETRVNRQGFERAWLAVNDLFEEDMLDEARDPESADARAQAGLEDDDEEGGASPGGAGVDVGEVGAALTPDQLKLVNEQVKNMGEEDMKGMLEQMANMGPAEEAALRKMGFDPGMMRKSIEMMKGNPMMLKAAQSMIGKMSPEQMAQASKQAQKQMQGMSKEDIDKAMKNMEK